MTSFTVFAATADVGRNELFELFHDTVTKRKAEVFDDVVVKFVDLVKNVLRDLVDLL